MNQTAPILSICIPAYNRPKWFERALESIILTNLSSASDIEIIISDDSTTDECRQISKETLASWPGIWKYVFNQPRLGMAKNWNSSIQLASGEYVLILHDDDFLRDRAVKKILQSIKKHRHSYPVLLFGVDVVNDKEKVIKRQKFSREQYLEPQQALYRLLSNSSFIRFPAICISRQVFKDVGYFDEAIGGIADLDMWIQLVSKFGILCVPFTTSAYTVHTNALTTAMFNKEVIEDLLRLFSKADVTRMLGQNLLEKSKSNFFHQFILAGTYRRLRVREFSEASQIMNLFNLQSLKQLQPSLKWFTLRHLFGILLKICDR
ncbi:glycosyltransferase family 2 protein [Pseudanabaena sp. PCC 6802]|uniref:glycosyltransferase family 2 protein n=1 Tax=Pseudanabaena sp. PCC 6802 TaxID=118173 RepID=UPI00034DC2FE|nr:glycosyltransferase family 2 protein [Pseudanabaena sp. PCC 6802]